jgi:hypothetical protein
VDLPDGDQLTKRRRQPRAGTRYARLARRQGGFMPHTHEYDCIVCGAHFDSQEDLAQHDRANHAPRQAIDPRAPAEPMGNERRRSKTGSDESPT